MRFKRIVSVVLFMGWIASYQGSAQQLNANPTCGKAGVTKVCLTGSGWAEPNPVCHYSFSFDGSTVAPNQPDGLFGPPKASFVVPAGAATGNHNIDVKLIEDDNNAVLQERMLPFQVVSAIADPWAATAANGDTINYSFDPSNVCDVSPCSKIVFIQVYQQFGINPDGSQVATKDSVWGLPAGRDADFTSNLFVLDRIFGKTIPYYHDGVGFGINSSSSSSAATSSDAPSQSNFPSPFTGIKINFETAAFCASGHDQGRYFGKILWTFQQSSGQAAGSVTISSTVRDQPSGDFIAAVNKWISNPDHSFPLPQPSGPSCQ